MTATTDQDTGSTDKAKWAELTVVGTEVHNRISKLQRGALADRSAEVAALARLRRGVGKPPGSVNEILQHTLSDVFAGPHAKDEPTEAESAAHIALTLFALHQQSQRSPVHRRGRSLGWAVRQLHPGEPGNPPSPILRRFQTLGTSQTLDELVHHMRGMVQLLRARPVPLDYGLLADELVLWQRPGGAARVRLRWGRDFYRTPRTTAPTTDPE
ncbi:type I-E CRISPR-associated protein Cse2/CasB [Actinosynnema sp. CA-248983]